jgi:hypothetical protein
MTKIGTVWCATDSPVLGWSSGQNGLVGGRTGRFRKKSRACWLKFTRQSGAPGGKQLCPAPTGAFNGGHMEATSVGPTVGRPHRTIRCARQPKALMADSTAVSAGYRGSLTVHCSMCIGQSGAPADRRQPRPSK